MNRLAINTIVRATRVNRSIAPYRWVRFLFLKFLRQTIFLILAIIKNCC
jgi:hypothetical protein